MRQIGVKGIFSAILAWAAIAILFFSASSSLYVEQNDRSLMKIQAARELTETTESMVRWLDKAIAEDYYNFKNDQGNCQGGNFTNNDIANFNTVIGKANPPYACSVDNPIIGDDTRGGETDVLTVTGTVNCYMTLGTSTISESRVFSFRKVVKDISFGAGKNCIVYDNVSKCTERPGFDLECNNTP